MMMKRILRLVCGAIIFLVLVNLITEFSVNDTLIGVLKDNVIYKEQDLETYFNLSTTNEEKQTYTNTYINWKNYKIVLMESVIDKNKHKGYLKFSVSKENTNMREIFINTQPSNQQTFGEEKDGYGRFSFFVNPKVKKGTISEYFGFIKNKKKLFVYYKYEIEGDKVQNPGYVYLWDRDIIGGSSHEDKIAGKFKIK